MSILININGKPAQGKSFSIKTLNPKKTAVINADKKAFGAYVGFEQDYNSENKNYWETDELDRVKVIMQGVSEKMPEIEVLILDTMTSVFEKYMHDLRKKPGFDKFKNVADEIFELMKFGSSLRKDLFVVFLSHVEEYTCVDAQGNESLCLRTATPGAKTKKDSTITKLLTFNFYSFLEMDDDGNKKYGFRVESNGKDEARSMYGMFDEDKIPNDLNYVVSTIKEKLKLS